jgi:hypothetical protein
MAPKLERNVREVRAGVLIALVSLGARPTAAQQSTRVVVSVSETRGGRPLPATVILTIAPTTESIVREADSSGTATFLLVGDQRTGEYIISASALGYRPGRQRLTAPASDSVYAVRLTLTSDTSQIAVVRVQASVPRAPRTFGVDPSVADGQNRRPDGVLNAVEPSQLGTLEALASTLPGLTRADGGISAFGLGATGTTVTVNGMQQGVTTLPRDLAVATMVLTSPWDVTRGAFSGALVSHTIQSGSNIHRRRGRLAVNGRYSELAQSQVSPGDRLAGSAVLSLGGSGAWLQDRGFYNYGFQFTQRSYQSLALAGARPMELARLGLSTETVRAVNGALSERGVPQSNGISVGGRDVRQLTFIQRLDLSARAIRGAGPPPALSLVYGGGVGDVGGIGASLANTKSTASTFSAANAFMQLTLAANSGSQAQVAHQTTLGVHANYERLSPTLGLPSGLLRTTSRLDDSRQVSSQVQFGGSALARERTEKRSVDLVHQSTWLLRGLSALPTKAMAQLRLDDGWTDASAPSAGQFEYLSTEAFRNGTAAAYSQTLGGDRVSSRLVSSALALSTAWEAQRLSLIGGLRMDAAQEIASSSSRRTSAFAVGPLRTIGLSPRVGFTFYPKAQRGPALYSNAVSSSYRTGPHLRGGIGVFRAAPSFSDVLRYSGGTGQGNTTTGIRCVGAAAPPYQWSSEIANPMPDACVPTVGTLAERWVDRRLLSAQYQPSEAVRSSLGWTSTFAGHYLALDVTRSDNRHLSGTRDLLSPLHPVFLLQNEGRRPVFVHEEAIDQSSGRIVRPPNSTNEGTAADRQLDARLRGQVHSASLFVIPRLPLKFGQVSVAYVASRARRQYRGFDGATAFSPADVEWANDARTPQHAVVVQGARLFRRGDVGISFSSRIASGERYSPLVEGDINGDGQIGDRAFIPGPTNGTDVALREAFGRFLQKSPANIRACLEKSVGAVAQRNSCIGPWTLSSNLAIVISRWPGLHQRAQVTVNVSNPLALLLPSGGTRSRLVSGGSAVVDQMLFRVTGFRQQGQQFSYELNENFGRTLAAVGSHDPLRLTIDVRLDLAPSADLQRLKLAVRAASGRGGSVSADTIKIRYRENVFEGLYTSLVRLADSLALSRAQIEAFQERDRIVRARIDSIYGTLAQELSVPEGRADLRAAAKRAVAADDAAWGVIYAESSQLRRLLSDGQIRRLPSAARSMVTVKDFRGRFFF